MLLNLCLFSVWVHKQDYTLHTASQHYIAALKPLQLQEKEETQYLFLWSRKPTPHWLFFTRRIPDNHAEQFLVKQILQIQADPLASPCML